MNPFSYLDDAAILLMKSLPRPGGKKEEPPPPRAPKEVKKILTEKVAQELRKKISKY